MASKIDCLTYWNTSCSLRHGMKHMTRHAAAQDNGSSESCVFNDHQCLLPDHDQDRSLPKNCGFSVKIFSLFPNDQHILKSINLNGLKFEI